MASRPEPPLSDALSGALDWWREAGVDYAFADAPQAWIKPAEPVSADGNRETGDRAPADAARNEPDARTLREALPPAPAVPEIDRANWPSDLSGFAQWWMEDPWLDEGRVAARVPPRGPAQAKLMVLVPEPEREDRDRLLSGREGALLGAMLSAWEIAEDQVYFASALPRHMPGADWTQIAARGLGEVLAHHVSLVTPERLAIFGASVLPLAGNDPPQAPADLRIFNHEGASLPLLAARSLAALLEQPRWKARVWRAWLDWTE